MTTIMSEIAHLACPDCGGVAYRDGSTFKCECGWHPRPVKHNPRDMVLTCPECGHCEFKATCQQNIDPAKRTPIRRCDFCGHEEDREPDPS